MTNVTIDSAPPASPSREELRRRLTNGPFDLLIIGGGVTGAGIALDAASRGLTTALIEKDDFAYGTSSRSTKLIHGGLRYLAQLDFKLVREVGRERAILHRNAPHLVVPESMLLPITKGGAYGKLMTAVGLSLYDFLARVRKADRRRMLSKQETLTKEPLLDPDRLRGGGLYAEYRTDDARLTLALALAAIRSGATALNYVKADQFVITDDCVRGVMARDMLDGSTFEILAKHTVNATGPWVDALRSLTGPLRGKRLHLTKGVHVVLSYEKLPVRQSIYFDVPDGRMIFAIPADDVTYVGTTDTTYLGDPDKPGILPEDTTYLLDAVNAFFPSITLSESDVISGWAGLRPLIHKEGRSPSDLSRKDEIFLEPNGLISIAGGKLTGYRKMAQRVVDLVVSREPNRTFEPCRTEGLRLAGGRFEDAEDVRHFIGEVQGRLRNLGLTESRATSLVHRYGRDCEAILDCCITEADEPIQDTFLRAEVRFAVEQEMVQRAADFFVRRTGKLHFDPEGMRRTQPLVLDELQSLLSWSDERKAEESKTLDDLLRQATGR